MKVVSIHQPSYWPWLGLLDKIAKTNTFILLDDAQVVKGTNQYRNIFYYNGEAKYITIPLNLKLGMNFNELTFRNDEWKKDHLNKLLNYYLKSPFFEETFIDLRVFYGQEFERPIDLLRETMIFCFNKLGIKVDLFLSSELNVDGKKGERVLNLCKKVGANIYLAGKGSYNYMQEYLPKFINEKIEVKWHSFQHPVYRQDPKYPFIEGLSCLDIFFFEGFENSKEIFWRNIRKNE